MPDSIIPAAVSSQLDNTGEERIHIANIVPGGVVRNAWSGPTTPVENIFIAYAGESYLRYSDDVFNLDYSNTVETGVSNSEDAFAKRVFSANGRLFHMDIGANTCATSTDGLNYELLTGTGLESGLAIETCLWTGDEYIFLQGNSANAMVTEDGVAQTIRAMGVTAGSGRGEQIGTIIVADSSTSNNVIRSVDSGVTWALVNMDGDDMDSMHAIRSATRFLVFGRDVATDDNVMKWSTTGASASWTSVTLPGSFSAEQIRQSCWHEDSGRIIVVRKDRAVYYSDDEGDTWTLGEPVPHDDVAYSETITHMKFANGKVYYMKPDDSTIDVKIYETTNGTTWTELFSEATYGTDSATNFATFLFP